MVTEFSAQNAIEKIQRMKVDKKDLIAEIDKLRENVKECNKLLTEKNGEIECSNGIFMTTKAELETEIQRLKKELNSKNDAIEQIKVHKPDFDKIIKITGDGRVRFNLPEKIKPHTKVRVVGKITIVKNGG